MIKTATEIIELLVKEFDNDNNHWNQESAIEEAKSFLATKEPETTAPTEVGNSDEYYNQLSKNLGKTQPYHFTGAKCITSCKRFTAYETKHHKDCPFYHGSLSEKYDKLENAELGNEWQGKNIWVEIPVSENNMPTTVGRRYHCFDLEGKPTLFHYTGSPVSKITFKEQIKSWLDKVDNQNIQ